MKVKINFSVKQLLNQDSILHKLNNQADAFKGKKTFLEQQGLFIGPYKIL